MSSILQQLPKKGGTLGQHSSWRDFVDSNDTLLNDLSGQNALNFADIITKYAKSYTIDKNNPSKLATLSEMSCKELFEREGIVYGLNQEERTDICKIVKRLGDYMLYIEAQQRHASVSVTDTYAFSDPLTTVYGFYEIVRRAIEAEDTKEALIAKSLQSDTPSPSTLTSKDNHDVRTQAIVDFHLDGLPEEDQEEMLLEVAKQIQKQFLTDIFAIVGEKQFEALTASVKMGNNFYGTTLKHLVPNYEELFELSREKVVKAFNAQ